MNEKIKWIEQASLKEILEKSIEENWSVNEFELYLKFKIAQFLERIALRFKGNKEELEG